VFRKFLAAIEGLLQLSAPRPLRILRNRFTLALRGFADHLTRKPKLVPPNVEFVTLMCARGRKLRVSPNCHYKWRKTGKNQQTPKNRDRRYLTAGKGIWLNFLRDGESAILFFKTAGFNRLPISAATKKRIDE
jgi:hypothetical protein